MFLSGSKGIWFSFELYTLLEAPTPARAIICRSKPVICVGALKTENRTNLRFSIPINMSHPRATFALLQSVCCRLFRLLSVTALIQEEHRSINQCGLRCITQPARLPRLSKVFRPNVCRILGRRGFWGHWGRRRLLRTSKPMAVIVCRAVSLADEELLRAFAASLVCRTSAGGRSVAMI